MLDNDPDWHLAQLRRWRGAGSLFCALKASALAAGIKQIYFKCCDEN
jgi:hypothetical protein